MSEGQDEHDEFAGLATRFDGFEQELLRHKQKKKDDIDQKLSELQSQITDMKAQMILEKQNSDSAMRALKAWLEHQIQDYTDSTVKPLHERLDQLNSKVDKAAERVGHLEKKLDASLETFPKLIDERSAELLDKISEHDKQFEVVKQVIDEKHEEVVAQVQETATIAKKHLEAERLKREQQDMTLRDDIDREVDIRKKGVHAVKESISEVALQLQTQITQEVKEREVGDKKLEKAMKHYVAALQDSIKIVAEQ